MEKMLVKDSEFYLDDIYDGLIALDNALKLVGKDADEAPHELPMSRGQAIGVILYVAAAVARDVERLRGVEHELSVEEAAKLRQYNQRLRKGMEKALKLRLLG